MSEFPSKQGKKKQPWTERALRRAGRACPDRLLRLNLQTGVLELVPMVGEDRSAGDGEDLSKLI